MSSEKKSDAEKFVREYWDHVKSWVRDLDSYGTDQFNVALYFTEEDAKWCRNEFQRWQDDVGREENVWAAARKFIRNRMLGIRKIQKKIDWLDGLTDYSKDVSWGGCRARAVADLEELTKGMKI